MFDLPPFPCGARFFQRTGNRAAGPRPHRIVLDLALPDHDGMELLKFLADQKCAADINLISSHGESIRDQAMKLGDFHGLNMHRTLPKPFSLDDLKAALA